MTTPSLKLKELEPNDDIPWEDDHLEREKIAKALSNLIKDETEPLVVSLNGGWGTGKTFLLKRWQKDLINNNYQAIYYNAWEDDYLGDPLVSIIGQLWETLKGTDCEEIVTSIKEVTKPILINTLFNFYKSNNCRNC